VFAIIFYIQKRGDVDVTTKQSTGGELAQGDGVVCHIQKEKFM